MTRVLVVSSDGHGGIPREQYRPYLEARYLDDFDDYDRTLEAWDAEAQPFPAEVMQSREAMAARTDFSDSQGRLPRPRSHRRCL